MEIKIDETLKELMICAARIYQYVESECERIKIEQGEDADHESMPLCALNKISNESGSIICELTDLIRDNLADQAFEMKFETRLDRSNARS